MNSRMKEIRDLLVRSRKEKIPVFIAFSDRSEETGVVEIVDQFFRGFIINGIGYSPEDIVEIELFEKSRAIT